MSLRRARRGSGKMVFLAILIAPPPRRTPFALVLAPTRELCVQVTQESLYRRR